MRSTLPRRVSRSRCRSRAAEVLVFSGCVIRGQDLNGFALEAVGKGEFLLVGIEWERDWRYRIEKDADGRWLSIDLAGLTHDMAPGETLSSPPATSEAVLLRIRN
jgi:hypothetical protein